MVEVINAPRVSKMAQGLVGSEIIKLGGEIKEKIAAGESIYNLTIGDFNANLFPIPDELKQGVIDAYNANETNYPPANGIAPLREAVAAFIERKQGLKYDANSFLVAGGARPLIYVAYQAIVDANEAVVFPVPSWNNNHYTHLAHGKQVFVETTAEDNFMPTVDGLSAHISEAGLIALCSPLNPTGTVFTKEQLEGICNLVLQENERRLAAGRKPVYVMYDQIYSQLLMGNNAHVDPVGINEAMRPFTIFIDGISKYLAATGVRVGWAFGPEDVIGKMKSILGHVGAWAPKPEQVATAKFLTNDKAVDSYLENIKSEIDYRLTELYKGFKTLGEKGLGVDVIAPQAAIYLSVKFDLVGKTTPNGVTLDGPKAITAYILDAAKIAVVPFYAFGTDPNSLWYRVSVGTLSKEAIPTLFAALEKALSDLK